MRRRHTLAEESLLARWRALFDRVRHRRWAFPEPVSISRKRHPLDCGRARCGICHGHKRHGHQPTLQERRAELATREMIDD